MTGFEYGHLKRGKSGRPGFHPTEPILMSIANGRCGAGRAIPTVRLTSRFGSTYQHDVGFWVRF